MILFFCILFSSTAGAGTKIFLDGFESGLPCSWSSADPAASCPPTFAGPALIAATGTTEISIGWLPAVDDSTPPGEMIYRVYLSEEEVGTKSAAKSTVEHVVVGGDGIVLQGLQQEWAYFIEVIAEDADGMQSAVPSFGLIDDPPSPGGREVITLSVDPELRSSVLLQRTEELHLGEAVATETTLTFQFGENSDPPAIGAVLIGSLAGGGGFVREVMDVVFGETEIVVETSPASVNTAAEAFQLRSSGYLFEVNEPQKAAVRMLKASRQPGQLRTPLVEMITDDREADTGELVVRPVEGDGRFRVTNTKGFEFGGDFEVDIDFDFKPEFTTDLEMNAGGIKTAKVVATGTLSMEALARYTFGASASWTPEPVEVFSHSWKAIYSIGSVPVYQKITLSLELQVTASAIAAIEATASAGASTMIQVGASYNESDGWTPIAGFGFDRWAEADIGFVGGAEAELRLIPKVAVEFYETIAGSITIEPSISGQLAAEDTLVEPCFPIELTDFSVDLEAEANVAIDLTWFDDFELFGATVWQSDKWVLFSLPTIELGAVGAGPVTITADVTNGVLNEFDLGSVDWRLEPATATLTPRVGDPLTAQLQCSEEGDTYTVTFSGHGILGPLSRSCEQIVVDCAPPVPNSLMAWGFNYAGQLGIGSTEPQYSPVTVPDLRDLVSIAAGGEISLVALDDGTVWAWGPNGNGQLGNGTTADSTVPVRVTGLTDVKQVATNGGRSYAVKHDGTVWGWGANWGGYLGDGTEVDRHTPVQIEGLSDIESVTVGSLYTMALKDDGTVWAWGDGSSGFGDGSTDDHTTPVQLPLSGIVKISSGSYHHVALGSNQVVYGWGLGTEGRLGYGGNVDKWAPVPAQISHVIDVSAGHRHTMAIKSDGSVWGWGGNDAGEVGVPPLTNKMYLPIEAEGISDVVSLTAGNWVTLALKEDGSLWVWGNNSYGAYGNGTQSGGTWIGVQVPGLPPIKLVATQYNHVLAATE